MTDLRKAAEMALEALIASHPIENTDKSLDKHSEAMSALRQALAQPDDIYAAVLAEREACAKVCDEHLLLGNKCAAAIRARGDKHD